MIAPTFLMAEVIWCANFQLKRSKMKVTGHQERLASVFMSQPRHIGHSA